MKKNIVVKINLITLLNKTHPGLYKLFVSPTYSDRSEKWWITLIPYGMWIVSEKQFESLYGTLQILLQKHYNISHLSKSEKLFRRQKDHYRNIALLCAYMVLIKVMIPSSLLKSVTYRDLPTEKLQLYSQSFKGRFCRDSQNAAQYYDRFASEAD